MENKIRTSKSVASKASSQLRSKATSSRTKSKCYNYRNGHRL